MRPKKTARKQRRRQLLKRAPETDDPRTRKCIATGATDAPDGFLRFVASPDSVVAPDFSGKLPGRGAWVSATREALETAIKKGAFAQSFKQGVTVPADLAERVEAGLAKLALSALGMARKTGDVVIGFDQVKASLKDKTMAVLIAATDGAEDGRRKLKARVKEAVLVEIFEGRELSSALGRDGVVHAALKDGAAATRFLKAVRRLEGFRKPETAPDQ